MQSKSAGSSQATSSKIKDKTVKNGANAPGRFCSILTATSSIQLDVETIKKLRLLLRNEPAG